MNSAADWYADQEQRERIMKTDTKAKMRLIDAYALIKNICNECVDEGTHCDQTDCLRYTERNRIESAPTVDAAPVRHGRWIPLSGWCNRGVAKCSECGNTLDMHGVNAGRGDANLCPNCGAKMDAEDTNVLTNDGGVENAGNQAD